MLQMAEIHSCVPDGVRLISSDVFDTLLLRTSRSQSSRILEGEKRFSALLATHGYRFRVEDLYWARSLAQKLSYRALDIGGEAGEVRLGDVIRSQLAMLGVPANFEQARGDIELSVEKSSLKANAKLAKFFRRLRRSNLRIVAVSDTALSGIQITELINYFHTPGLVDAVYSSADFQGSKRRGDLFDIVMEREGMDPHQVVHFGDDHLADVVRASSRGIYARQIETSKSTKALSKVNGGVTQAQLLARRRWAGSVNAPVSGNRFEFGRDILGPVVAEFALKIWLYSQQAASGEPSAILFCARGGVGIREAFERLVRRLSLPCSTPRAPFFISRLIAARTAVEQRAPAALQEIGREFHGQSFRDVAKALGGRDFALPEIWDATFEPDRFYDLLDMPAAAELRWEIEAQNTLFRRHLATVSGGAKRIILCDTGLYGSTQRLLMAGVPGYRFETIQLARSNYKGFDEGHFSKVAGLVVENNGYDPLRIETVLLRYWQMVESLFEPAVSSAKELYEDEDGEVAANCGDLTYPLAREKLNEMLLGTLDYIDNLDSAARICQDGCRSWRRLKQAITNPGVSDVEMLDVVTRSVDFGRQDHASAMQAAESASFSQRLQAVRSSLWREGAISRDFSTISPFLLTGLEIFHAARIVSRRFSR